MLKSMAIVTGSSSGIGKATATRLSHDFSAVVLAARSAAELGEVAEQVRANGAEPLAIDLDLMALTAAETVVSQTLAKFGRIDALVNIAGAMPGIDLFQMTDQQWNVGMELKPHGARRLTLQAWEALKSAKGAVVLMAGNTAEVPIGRCGWCDQCCDRRPGQDLCRPGTCRWHPGEQRVSRVGHDWPAAIDDREMGLSA
jgi:3-oxoacyl-[acyl-carrier protein] reductase